MRQETGSVLVQVMTCRLTAPSHYLSQYWLNVNWTLRNKLHWYFKRHSIIFIEENTFENVVCDFPAKLSRGRWVNAVKGKCRRRMDVCINRMKMNMGVMARWSSGKIILVNHRNYVPFLLWVRYSFSNNVRKNRSGFNALDPGAWPLCIDICFKRLALDVMTWKHFPHYWPLWGEPSVIDGFPHKGQLYFGLWFFFIATLNKVLDKQSSCWWLDTLWYLCEVTVLCLLILNDLSMQWNTNINVLNDTISKLFLFCVHWKALIKALIYFSVSRNWEVAYVWYKTPSRPNSGHNSGNCLQNTT